MLKGVAFRGVTDVRDVIINKMGHKMDHKMGVMASFALEFDRFDN